MTQQYDVKNCQSLFGYAQKIHERSGGVCQLCSCGAGPKVDFDLWRQMSVEHVIGHSQGGYSQQVRAILQRRFSGISQDQIEEMLRKIDEANIVTACSFCNSSTSRHKAPKSMEDLITQTEGTPEEVTEAVVQAVRAELDEKRRIVRWKLEAIEKAFREQLEEKMLEARTKSRGTGLQLSPSPDIDP